MADVATRAQNGLQVRSPFGDWLGWDPFRNFASSPNLAPGIEVTRSETGYAVEVPVPGYKPDQIDVTLDEHVLTVAGKAEKRQFTRSLLLPEEIDAETIAARVEHGMLSLTLNFHPKAQPKKIAVESSGN
ncbi:MAG TPA: Hsp20/alpha crystallin family protein [Candidatus Acidoferrales bacterium]|jgi:HSP20 family protein|nr:Hsp20/alpha crystallin family protein [Candidatus Acidoferrales bacterium]